MKIYKISCDRIRISSPIQMQAPIKKRRYQMDVSGVIFHHGFAIDGFAIDGFTIDGFTIASFTNDSCIDPTLAVIKNGA